MNRIWRLLILATMLLISTGCADPTEYATFHATGFNGLPDCMIEQFPAELDFHAARQRTDNLGIFLQTAPDIKSRNDVIYFEIYQPDSVGTHEAIPLGSALDSTTQARGKLVFSSSCPFYRESLELQGTLVFESIELSHGGIIAGKLEDGFAVNPRTEQRVIDEIRGSWRFIVRKGPPYEDFFALPERPEPGDF